MKIGHKNPGVKAIRSKNYSRNPSLTVTRETMKRFKKLKPGDKLEVEFCNDIISSSRGGNSVIHHGIRRVKLLKRQLTNEHKGAYIRSSMGDKLPCLLVGFIKGDDDACVCKATVRRQR